MIDTYKILFDTPPPHGNKYHHLHPQKGGTFFNHHTPKNNDTNNIDSPPLATHLNDICQSAHPINKNIFIFNSVNLPPLANSAPNTNYGLDYLLQRRAEVHPLFPNKYRMHFLSPSVLFLNRSFGSVWDEDDDCLLLDLLLSEINLDFGKEEIPMMNAETVDVEKEILALNILLEKRKHEKRKRRTVERIKMKGSRSLKGLEERFGMACETGGIRGVGILCDIVTCLEEHLEVFSKDFGCLGFLLLVCCLNNLFVQYLKLFLLNRNMNNITFAHTSNEKLGKLLEVFRGKSENEMALRISCLFNEGILCFFEKKYSRSVICFESTRKICFLSELDKKIGRLSLLNVGFLCLFQKKKTFITFQSNFDFFYKDSVNAFDRIISLLVIGNSFSGTGDVGELLIVLDVLEIFVRKLKDDLSEKGDSPKILASTLAKVENKVNSFIDHVNFVINLQKNLKTKLKEFEMLASAND